MANLQPIILASAERWNVDPALVGSVVQQESSGNPAATNKSGGGQGAYGAMQIRQAALSDYNAANGTNYQMQDLLKPQVGIDVGTWYLGKQLDKFNDPSKALVAYNEGAGSPTVQKGSSPYSQSVLGRVNMPQQQLLPGIPGAQPQGNMSDDAIFSSFTKGNAPAQAPQQGPSDDQILASFTKSVPAAPASTGAPSATPNAQPAPAEQPNSVMSFLAGLGRGVQETALGVQQHVGAGLNWLGQQNQGMTSGGNALMGAIGRAGNWLMNDANQGLQQGAKEVAPYQATHPFVTGAGTIGGSIAASAPLLGAAPVAATLPGMAAGGVALGAASGALAPVSPTSTNFWRDTAKNMEGGALGGLVMAPVAGAIGRVISPNVSPDVQTLIDRGVTPTPGQILGGGFARTEDKLTSIPFLGDLIKNAQGRALGQFNVAAYDQALAPIGEKFTGSAGQEGIEQVGKQIGAAYDRVLPQMQLKVDPQFQADVTNLGQMANGLPDSQQRTFMNILKTQIFDKLGPQGNMDGQTLKGVQSELARTSSGYLKDPSFDNRQLGAAVSALRDAVDSNLARVNPSDLADQLANANQAWANFTRLRTAGSSIGAANNEGVFTAAQLQNAVKSGDKSVGKGAFATGNALMQDLSGAGQRVLGSKYPDSGTAGRGLMALLAPGGVAAGLATAPGSTAATLGGIGLASLPYTQLGQRAMAALLTSRPQLAQSVGNAVTQFGPRVVAGSLPALLSGGR